MENEVKKVSNTYEVVTLKQTKISRKVVNEIQTMTKKQMQVYFWELVADRDKIIREKAMLEQIRDIKNNVS